MILSVDLEKVFGKIQHLFVVCENVSKLGKKFF